MLREAHLVVHTSTGVVEVPLTGDPDYDAALERIARRGGTVLRNGALREEDSSEAEMRAALQGGA